MQTFSVYQQLQIKELTLRALLSLMWPVHTEARLPTGMTSTFKDNSNPTTCKRLRIKNTSQCHIITRSSYPIRVVVSQSPCQPPSHHQPHNIPQPQPTTPVHAPLTTLQKSQWRCIPQLLHPTAYTRIFVSEQYLYDTKTCFHYLVSQLPV